jgi:hypothetical protein
MSIVAMLLAAAVGSASSAADSSATASENTPLPANSSANVAPASPGRTPSQWRQSIADAMRKANSAKSGERGPAVETLAALFNELGQDQQLSATERNRLGAEIRSRLQRFANQFRYEATHRSTSNGAAGGAAAEGLDNLVDLIAKTIGPQDWVLAQRIGPPGQQGGQAGAAANRNGGAASGFEADVNANGQALANLIEDTIAPDSWDVRGGPGSIYFYGPLRALVVRQTGEGHEAMDDLLNALRR